MEKIREEINKIDIRLIGLLGKRMRLAKKIGEIKNKSGIRIWDKTREEMLRKTYASECKKYGISKDFINDLFDVIFSESQRIQKNND